MYTWNNPIIADGLHANLAAMPPAGYAGAAAAIRDMSLKHRIAQIAVPVLVVSGESDVATPFAPDGADIVTAIAGARSQTLACGHLAPIEAPSALAGLLRTFLLAKPETQTAAATLFEAGMRNRRRILGDAWVDQSLAARTPFNADFQEMIARTAWQEIWGRPGLDERTRRLLVIAITATQGRWEEFCLHVRAGIERDGFSLDELKETLMQLAVYAGVPAANTAFSEAGKILAQVATD
jgi:3-oxoadipate enol-lactonase/4-carboxymuconolactone decarboxylase